MTKVNEIIVDVLEDLLVQEDEAPIEQSEGLAVIRRLNDMMSMWAAKGVNLGYTLVTKSSDDMTVAAGAIFGIKANLVILLAPKYDVPITMNMTNNAKVGYEAILDLAIHIVPSEYPDRLPRGSGNDYPGYEDATFYPDSETEILDETGGSIALEEDTEIS